MIRRELGRRAESVIVPQGDVVRIEPGKIRWPHPEGFAARPVRGVPHRRVEYDYVRARKIRPLEASERLPRVGKVVRQAVRVHRTGPSINAHGARELGCGEDVSAGRKLRVRRAR